MSGRDGETLGGCVGLSRRLVDGSLANQCACTAP